MAEILDKSYWIINEDGLVVLGRPAAARLSEVNAAINADLDMPIRIHAALVPDTKLYIRQQSTPMGDGGAKSTGPLGTTVPAFTDSTIDFQTNLTTGSPISISFPASTLGRFRRCVFSLDNTGTLIAAFTPEALTVGALVNPGPYFLSGSFPIGWVDLECTNITGKFKTAGSSTSIIENAQAGTPRIFRVGAGGGGGSSGGNSGVAQEDPIANATDTFTITFPTPLIATVYVPIVCVNNYTDPSPQFLTAVVVNKTVNGFDVLLNAPTDSANYVLSYIVPVCQEQVGEAAVLNAATTVTVTLAIPLTTNAYSVVAQFVNYIDGAPQFQPVSITAKTATTFTAKWNAPTDSGNYLLAYHVAEYV
jgi:hypothetical protein